MPQARSVIRRRVVVSDLTCRRGASWHSSPGCRGSVRSVAIPRRHDQPPSITAIDRLQTPARLRPTVICLSLVDRDELPHAGSLRV